MTTDDIFEFVRAHQGKRLETTPAGAGFAVSCEPGEKVCWRIRIWLESSQKERVITNRRILDEIVQRYQQAGVLDATTYKDIKTPNLPYILAIMKALATDSR